MPRFFVKIAYDGSKYHGWQRQPNSVTVQEIVENALQTIYRKPIEVLGCGRTDAGVHASCFYFHVDLDQVIDQFVFRFNSLLPLSVKFEAIYPVADDAHARFDAIRRSYRYFAHGEKSPFLHQYSSHIIELKKTNLEALNQVPKLLLQYEEFLPFCKTNADNKTMRCALSFCDWSFNPSTQQYILDVTSDRFLRGMIRLIVGASVLVAQGTLSIDAVKNAMDQQTRLPKSLSAPAQGLFLNEVIYPYINPSP